MNYDFGELGNQVRDACNEYPPKLDEIERLMEQCGDLNIVSPEAPEENMLSDIILWYPELRELQVYCEDCGDESCEGCGLAGEADGRWLPQIVRLFLKHGFDVAGNDGMAGRMCLSHLMLSSGDIYAIEAEKFLLDAGADPLIRIEGETAAEQYGGEASFRAGEGQYWHENLYHTMKEIARMAGQHRDYRGIEFFECCIGKRIDRIEAVCTDVIPSRAIYSVGFHRNCFASPLVFWCEGKQLCVTRWLNVLVNPNVRGGAKGVTDISRFFPGCIGSRIVSMEFPSSMPSKGKTRRRPFLRFRLDNGRSIDFFLRTLKYERMASFAVERGNLK